MLAEACLTPGQNLVMASPTFQSIAHAAKLVAADVRNVPLTHEYAHDLPAMLTHTDAKTGVVYICNPNKPTGTLTPKSALEAFLRKLPSETFVVMDEAYHDYVFAEWSVQFLVDSRRDRFRADRDAHGFRKSMDSPDFAWLRGFPRRKQRNG